MGIGTKRAAKLARAETFYHNSVPLPPVQSFRRPLHLHVHLLKIILEIIPTLIGLAA